MWHIEPSSCSIEEIYLSNPVRNSVARIPSNRLIDGSIFGKSQRQPLAPLNSFEIDTFFFILSFRTLLGHYYLYKYIVSTHCIIPL
jgi:hypothetical protein